MKPRSNFIHITTPPFDFSGLARAHGWYVLKPFEWNEQDQQLRRPLRLADGTSVTVEMGVSRVGEQARVRVKLTGTASRQDRALVRHQVRRMLALDQNLDEFHAQCEADPVLSFAATSRYGRLLRSPTAFEDLIKTICTINCNWRNTIRMCEHLCDIGGGDFPSPAQLLRFRPAKLAERARLGYRSRTVLEVARLTAKGKLPLDEWAAAGDFDQVRMALKSIWGVGPYALNHMLVLLGDFSTIPVDSEVLKYLRGAHFGGKNVSAVEAVRPYDGFGDYRFLAYKCGRIARRINGAAG